MPERTPSQVASDIRTLLEYLDKWEQWARADVIIRDADGHWEPSQGNEYLLQSPEFQTLRHDGIKGETLLRDAADTIESLVEDVRQLRENIQKLQAQAWEFGGPDWKPEKRVKSVEEVKEKYNVSDDVVTRSLKPKVTPDET